MSAETFDLEVTAVEVDEENPSQGYVTFRARMPMSEVRKAAMFMYDRAPYVVTTKEGSR